jgi:hypothetical protein
MKTIRLLSLVLLAAASVACDPYDDVKTGTPEIITVIAANSIDGVDPVLGTSGDAGWTVTGATCGGVLDDADAVVNPGAFDQSYFVIVFDRQVDGALIQSDPVDCTPAPTSVTITPAPATGNAWYTCYNPSAGTGDWGGSIVVYQAAEGGSNGWGDFEYLPSDTYTITGNVAGRQIDVTVAPCAP